MEKCDTSVSKYIRENQDIKTAEKLDLIIQMSKALAYLHANNWCHTDVKPSNFLLKMRCKGWPIVKLTDLGFRKTIKGSSNEFNSKLDYAAMAWIAPELYEPPFHFHSACDVWSFGCVIYYSLTGGKHPFDSPEGRSLADRATNIIKKKVNLMALKKQGKDIIDPKTNTSLQSLITSAISHDPSSRPTSEAIVKQLGQLLSQQLRITQASTDEEISNTQLAIKPNQGIMPSNRRANIKSSDSSEPRMEFRHFIDNVGYMGISYFIKFVNFIYRANNSTLESNENISVSSSSKAKEKGKVRPKAKAVAQAEEAEEL